MTVKKKLWLFVFLTNVSKTQYQHSTPNVSQFQQARYKRRPNAGETLSIARTRRIFIISDSKDRETQEWSRHATRQLTQQRNETTLTTKAKAIYCEQQRQSRSDDKWHKDKDRGRARNSQALCKSLVNLTLNTIWREHKEVPLTAR